MDKKDIIEKFYQNIAKTLGMSVTAESKLVTDLNMSSADYLMMIAEMEELGIEDVTYKMLKKCETMSEVEQLMLEQLEN